VFPAPRLHLTNADRARDFSGLLDRLQKALEARFKGYHVAIGPDAIPLPAHVIVHDRDLSHASAKKAIREELDRIEPEWAAWLAVDR
jgi:hypothetical protein